jgi:hypothetical protein
MSLYDVMIIETARMQFNAAAFAEAIAASESGSFDLSWEFLAHQAVSA